MIFPLWGVAGCPPTLTAATPPCYDVALASVITPATAPVLGLDTPLYRLFNAQTGDRLYTTDAAERDVAVQQHGYILERVEALVAADPGAELVPLLRFSNGRDHFYTTDAGERIIAEEAGYTSEGIACYVLARPLAGTKPLFRLLQPERGDHFYTTDRDEADKAVGTGYVLEGVVGYVAPAPR